MPVSLRVVATLWSLLLRLGYLRTVLVAMLVLMGLVRGHAGGMEAVLSWWAAAAGLLLLTWVAQAMDYLVFLPDAAIRQEAPSQAAPVLYARATGRLRAWDRLRGRWGASEMFHGVPVQVRWLGEQSPPYLAALRPLDLPPDLEDPVREADAASLWHPGVEVTTGWVFLGWKVYPGLRLSFPGKRLYLALGKPVYVVSCVNALETGTG